MHIVSINTYVKPNLLVLSLLITCGSTTVALAKIDYWAKRFNTVFLMVFIYLQHNCRVPEVEMQALDIYSI